MYFSIYEEKVTILYKIIKKVLNFLENVIKLICIVEGGNRYG